MYCSALYKVRCLCASSPLQPRIGVRAAHTSFHYLLARPTLIHMCDCDLSADPYDPELMSEEEH